MLPRIYTLSHISAASVRNAEGSTSCAGMFDNVVMAPDIVVVNMLGQLMNNHCPLALQEASKSGCGADFSLPRTQQNMPIASHCQPFC